MPEGAVLGDGEGERNGQHEENQAGIAHHAPKMVAGDDQGRAVHGFVFSSIPQLSAGELDEQVFQAGLPDGDFAHVSQRPGDGQEPGQFAFGVLDGQQQLGFRDLDQLELRVQLQLDSGRFRAENAAQGNDLPGAGGLAKLLQGALGEDDPWSMIPMRSHRCSASSR